MRKSVKQLLVFTLIGLLIIFSTFMLVDRIFYHRETPEHLSRCPFSGVIHGVTVTAIFLLLIFLALLLIISFRFSEEIRQQSVSHLPELRAPPSL